MRVLCTLPNASKRISGVTFFRTPEGVLSEEIDEETAAQFTAIPGYSLSDKEPDLKEADPEQPEPKAASPETNQEQPEPKASPARRSRGGK